MIDQQAWNELQAAFGDLLFGNIAFENARSVLEAAGERARKRQELLQHAQVAYEALVRFELAMDALARGHEVQAPLRAFIENFYTYFKSLIAIEPPHWLEESSGNNR